MSRRVVRITKTKYFSYYVTVGFFRIYISSPTGITIKSKLLLWSWNAKGLFTTSKSTDEDSTPKSNAKQIFKDLQPVYRWFCCNYVARKQLGFVFIPVRYSHWKTMQTLMNLDQFSLYMLQIMNNETEDDIAVLLIIHSHGEIYYQSRLKFWTWFKNS